MKHSRLRALGRNVPSIAAVGAMFVFLSVVITLRSLPIADTVQFGGDEGAELMKALLVHRGYTLYNPIWSDQPPLYTFLLDALFSWFGEAAFWPRMLSILATGVCGVVLFRLTLLCGGGLLGGVVSCLLLLGSPICVELGVSAMQEVAMLALSLVSSYLALGTRCNEYHRIRLLAAGCLMGAALGIKFTALLWFVAAVAALVAWHHRTGTSRNLIAAHLCCYVGSALGVAFVILLTLGHGTLTQMVSDHYVFARALPGFASQPKDFHFDERLVLLQPDLYLIAALGLVWLLTRGPQNVGDWFCLMSLVVQATFAVFYRPWWDFYLTGLSAPLILIGAGVVGKIATAATKSAQQVSEWRARLARTACLLAFLVLLGALNLNRLSNALIENETRAKLKSSDVILALQRHLPKGKWLFTQEPIFAFHVGLLVPPDYAVVSKKRVWSGQDPIQLAQTVVDRYKPGWLLIEHDYLQVLRRQIARGQYERVWTDHARSLYIRGQ